MTVRANMGSSVMQRNVYFLASFNALYLVISEKVLTHTHYTRRNIIVRARGIYTIPSYYEILGYSFVSEQTEGLYICVTINLDEMKQTESCPGYQKPIAMVCPLPTECLLTSASGQHKDLTPGGSHGDAKQGWWDEDEDLFSELPEGEENGLWNE